MPEKLTDPTHIHTQAYHTRFSREDAMKMLVALFVLSFLIQKFQCENGTYRNSYYFRIGKNNNELKVNNRVYFLNHNISDLNYPNGRIQKTARTNVEASQTPKAKFRNDLYLDDEWDYSPRKSSRSDLPLFVQKFYDKALHDPTASHSTRILFNDNRNSSSSVIKFDLEGLSDDEDVIEADLYFYWPLKNTSAAFKESVVLRLYQFERSDNGGFEEEQLVQNPDVHKLFNVIYVSKAQKGWQTFKLKKPLNNWLNGEENLGLLLTISSYEDNKLIEIFNDTNDGVFGTFCVIKSQKNDTSDSEDSGVSAFPKNFTDCVMVEWRVNFTALGWDNFIIHPREFTTYDCAGKCNTLDEIDNNHVKLLDVFRKRSGCCVPISYQPLPIMFFDRVGNIVIKNYRDLIVKGCGCR